MAIVLTQEQVEQRNKDIATITETLKTLGHATSFDISDLTGINRNRVKMLMKSYVMEQNPGCVKSVHGKGYFWEGPTEEPKKEEKPERYPETHNHEGYPDPTMARAMRNVMNNDYTPGEVWVFNDFNGEEKMYLILGSIKGSVTGLMVNEVDSWFNEEQNIPITVKGKMYYVDPWRILSKPARVLKRSRDTISGLDLSQIRASIGKFLGVEPNTKVVEVEKVVEKEVPVEVVKEVEVEADISKKFEERIADLEKNLRAAERDTEMAMQSADIWERAFYAVTGTKMPIKQAPRNKVTYKEA